jgi:dTDP-D-glucose 4,6-dehydratase
VAVSSKESWKPVDIIINMASESAVERSVSDPGACWRNNCELAYNMLELARRLKPEIFFQISTDEVYGDCPANAPAHHEWDVILPSNPYAASKAAQEALAISIGEARRAGSSYQLHEHDRHNAGQREIPAEAHLENRNRSRNGDLR